MIDEEWRPVVGFERIYEVSYFARVRRIAGGPGARAGRILRQSLNSDGCPQVSLYLRGKVTTRKVAHLVADAFLPPKGPTDRVLRHLNDDPTDNQPCNLAWGTRLDNAADAIHNDRYPRGGANGAAKLTEDQVREIRRLWATGNFSQRKIARQFVISNVAVSKIVRRQTWTHIL